MSSITFDTLKYTKELERSGVDPKQAEAQANALSNALSEALETQLATKSDIADLKSEITRVDGRLNLITWMLALVVIATVVPALKSLFS